MPLGESPYGRRREACKSSKDKDLRFGGFSFLPLDIARPRVYNVPMNENEQCVECDRDDVYLIDGEICQDCDEALYDDAF